MQSPGEGKYEEMVDGEGSDVDEVATPSLQRQPSHEEEHATGLQYFLDHRMEGNIDPGAVEDDGKPVRFNLRRFMSFTGASLAVSIGFLDPGNLGSDLAQGIGAGYHLGWILLVSTAAGIVLQIVASRVGIVSGHDLQTACRLQYGPLPTLVLLFALEIAVITADIQEVIGSAIGMSVLSNGAISLPVGVLISAVDVFFLLFIERLGTSRLEMFFALLIGIMAVAFVASFFISEPAAGPLLYGTVVPLVPKGTFQYAMGTIGAIVMPHNIMLGSTTPRSRFVPRRDRRRVEEAVMFFSYEAIISIGVSFFINAAVVAVFAEELYDPTGKKLCPTKLKPHLRCVDVGLEEAHIVLDRALGPAAKYLWGVGLLAAGQSSTMTGALAGQYLVQGFAQLKIPLWQQSLLTRSLALVPAGITALLFASSIDGLNELVNILQSIIIPFATVPLLMIAASPEIMGPYATPRWANISLWTLNILIIAANVVGVAQPVVDHASPAGATFAVLGGILYLIVILYYILVPPGNYFGHRFWRTRDQESLKTLGGCCKATCCICCAAPFHDLCPLPRWVPYSKPPSYESAPESGALLQPDAPSISGDATQDLPMLAAEVDGDDKPFWRSHHHHRRRSSSNGEPSI